MVKKKRNIFLFIFLILILIAGGGYYYINSILSSGFDIDKTVYIYIDESKNYDAVLTQIDTSAHVQNREGFKQLASYMKYPESIKTGRYAITPDMNIRQAIRMLQLGQQSPVRLTFNNIRLKKDLAKRISEQLMLDESELIAVLNSPQKALEYGFTEETFGAMFIPNTYETYWDTSAENFLKRMKSEYNRFWTEERKKKASAQGLTPVEVSILASIVEEECYFADEYPTVAGLYLNRLKRGQLLQADPTVKYAVGDFSLQRVLNRHLEVDSPYNTYKYQGLPPGPIRIPSIKGIDAVLNPADHSYLYMCAKEDFSGRHNFAVTHAEHERNAARYRKALNERRIFR
ncbi:MAG TPA: endolytic transglycosylase MltG [Dysgonomonas sp.]|nr:endolytic transglycosylase MltG [Dysgonomonas sp.]